METLNFELSKKLNEAGILDNIDTEYVYEEDCGEYYLTKTSSSDNRFENYKTLTLQEAIDFLPNRVTIEGKIGEICFDKSNVYYINLGLYGGYIKQTSGRTLIEALEKMIELLFDKSLIGQNTKNSLKNLK